MASITSHPTTIKYPWDPPTPKTARTSRAIFLPPPHEFVPLLPSSMGMGMSTPQTAHSTCSIFELETPSSTAWMGAKCSLGVAVGVGVGRAVVPRVVVPNSGNHKAQTKGQKKCGGWEIYRASLPLRKAADVEPALAVPSPSPLPGTSRQVLAQRMKALLARRVPSILGPVSPIAFRHFKELLGV